MKVLQKGANALLTTSGGVDVELSWRASPVPLDISCFMVRADGRVPSDDYMVFYNQARDPAGAVTLQESEAQASRFALLTQAMPPEVEKCVFTATLDGPGTFRDVQGLTVRANAPDGGASYAVEGVADERALILAEVYRHGDGWKLRAVGQGFNGGLEPLARHFGVVVEEAPPPAAPTPAAPPEKSVNLTKVDLLKKAVKVSLEKKKLSGERARVAVVLDASGSMSMLYQKGTVQRAFERSLAVAACMDDDGEMDVWFFGSKPMRGPSVTERDFEGYVQRVYPGPKFFGGLGCGNNEPAVMRDLVKKYTKESPNPSVPVYVLFFSDGGIYEDAAISKILKEASNQPIFWQFVGIGNANYGILRKLDDLPGRHIDNADFFALDDLDRVSDEELYDRMLNEFPAWLKEARNKGVLRS